MSDINRRFWAKVRTVPEWAKKPIAAGRLKGKTDINPQWRMQIMTETFGPVGFGWKYAIDKLWTEPGNADQVMAFALVSVWISEEGEWSEPVPGIGGSMLVAKESSGLYTSDEGYKMAVTDALSVAFKAIGVAADIYSGDKFDGSKYDTAASSEASTEKPKLDDKCLKPLKSASTMDELKKAWEGIPVGLRKQYNAAKEDAKKRIEAGS